MTGKEICERAKECAPLKYWYGGKGEVASVSLANRLRSENPNVWTDSSYKKALKDVDGHTRVGDCSYLVCHAYDRSMIGSYEIVERYPEWIGTIRDGMILWRKGHVGVYENGHVHELRGIDYDYQFSLYDPDRWSKVLYDTKVSYVSWVYPEGWNQNQLTGEWWYQYGPGEDDYFRNRVVRINGDYFAFRDNGYMVCGKATIETNEDGEIISVT